MNKFRAVCALSACGNASIHELRKHSLTYFLLERKRREAKASLCDICVHSLHTNDDLMLIVEHKPVKGYIDKPTILYATMNNNMIRSLFFFHIHCQKSY